MREGQSALPQVSILFLPSALPENSPWSTSLHIKQKNVHSRTLPNWSFLPKPVAAAMLPAPSTVFCATAVTPVTTASPTFVTCSLVFSATGINQEWQIKGWWTDRHLK